MLSIDVTEKSLILRKKKIILQLKKKLDRSSEYIKPVSYLILLTLCLFMEVLHLTGEVFLLLSVL